MAPAGRGTRPTADRVRQALFDMLMHAPWGGRAFIEGSVVLDAFAGTGALGLEALSRGAARAIFFETDPAAIACLRANIAGCGAASRARVMTQDVLRAPRGSPCGLIFLDPPYGRGILQPCVNHLRAEGWMQAGGLVVTETSTLDQVVEIGSLLDHRVHGAAQLRVWRA